MTVCSSKNLYVVRCGRGYAPREFNSIEELWESGNLTEKESVLLGTFHLCWWKDCVVMFPDKQSGSSQAMVEVQNKEVTVGYGNCYYSIYCESQKEALYKADDINNRWLKWSSTPEQFVTLILNESSEAELAE